MRRRRYHDREGIAFVDQRRHIVERPDTEFVADLFGALGPRFVKSDEARAFHFPQDADVVKAQGARADDTDACGRAQMMIPRSVSPRNLRKCSTSGDEESSVAARSRACDTFNSERKNNR